jgi:hypothetical protein
LFEGRIVGQPDLKYVQKNDIKKPATSVTGFLTQSPNCFYALMLNVKLMEEVEGFEPPRGVTRLSVFKTDPFSRTWVYLRDKKYNIMYFKLSQHIF